MLPRRRPVLVVLREEQLPARPRTRGECLNGPRPCIWVGCRYHLYLEVSDGGLLKQNFPGLEPDELIESCALDVGGDGEHTLDEVGQLIGLTRERIRQIEMHAARKLGRAVRDSIT